MSNTESEYIRSLQEEIVKHKADKEALVAEFAKSADPNTDVRIAKEAFARASAQAITNVILLSEVSDSDSVRLAASKYVIEAGLGSKLTEADSNDGALKELFESIRKKAKVPDTATASINSIGTTLPEAK